MFDGPESGHRSGRREGRQKTPWSNVNGISGSAQQVWSAKPSVDEVMSGQIKLDHRSSTEPYGRWLDFIEPHEEMGHRLDPSEVHFEHVPLNSEAAPHSVPVHGEASMWIDVC